MVKQETKSGCGLMDAQPQSSTNTTSSQLSGYRIVNMNLLGEIANIRAVASARNCGMGYQQIIQFTAGLRESAVPCQEECYSSGVFRNS